MRMEENINERFSLRINGAFVAPTVLFYEGDMELSENLDLIAEEFLKKVNKEINLFLETNNLEEYIFSDNIVIDKNILRCLSYIDSGLLSEAKKLAEEQLLSGNTGRFVNEGRGFLQYSSHIQIILSQQETAGICHFVRAVIIVQTDKGRHIHKASLCIGRYAGMARHERLSCRVQRVYHVLDPPGLTAQFFTIGPVFRGIFLIWKAQHDLIHVGPDYHRWMVERLLDHLLRHQDTVIGKRLRFRYGINDRYLDRGQDPKLVTHLQDQRVLRIMRYAKKISAHFLKQLHV